MVNKPVHAWPPSPFLPPGPQAPYLTWWGSLITSLALSRKVPLLLGYVCFPPEAWGWLGLSQSHCAAQSVGWGLGWTLVLFFTSCQLQSGRPMSGSEEWPGSLCWPTTGASGLPGPGRGVKQAGFPGMMGLPAVSTGGQASRLQMQKFSQG